MKAFSFHNKKALAFFALLIVSLLFALSRMPGGIGGTGITGTPGGIGGTGIYGRIDAFGSIWVNGVEIFYEEDQVVVRQGRDRMPENLKLGQIVAVVIDEETGRANARSIEIIEEVNGPIEGLEIDKFEVLGQKIILTDDTIIEGDLINGSQFTVGGFRAADGTIVASRIAPPLINGEIALRGTVNRISNDGYWVGDQEIIQDDITVDVGQMVEIRGRLNREGPERPVVMVESFVSRGPLPFYQMPERISYQGVINDNGEMVIGKESPSAMNMDVGQINADVMDLNLTVVDFEPQLVGDVVDLSEIKAENFKPEFKNTFNRERIRTSLRERREQIQQQARRNAEIEARRLTELETRRAAEIEARRQGELETRRLAEIEGRRQAEGEARRLGELEARKQAEIEARQVEVEARRLAELEARRQAELEARRQAEIAVRGQAEFEARREAELKARRSEAVDARTQADTATRDDIQNEAQDQAAGEVRERAREQIRQQIRERLREEARRKARRELLRPPN